MQASIFKYKFSRQTKMIGCYLSVLLISVVLINCQKEKVASKEYPRLTTLDVTDISASGMTFKANILSGNLADIKEYGFVWDISYNPIIEIHSKNVLTGDISGNQFRTGIMASLEKNKLYHVRAYLKTEDVLVYGKIVEFKVP